MTSSRLTATPAFIFIPMGIFWKCCIRLENADKTPVYLPDNKIMKAILKTARRVLRMDNDMKKGKSSE